MSVISIICYNNGEHLNSIIEYDNEYEYNEINDCTYVWICPNPVCAHCNKLEKSIIIERAYCNGCNSFIIINQQIQAFAKTLRSLDVNDDEYLHLMNKLHLFALKTPSERLELYNEANGVNQNNKEKKNIYLRKYSEYTTNNYKEINGEIVIIDQIVNDKIEQYKQYVSIMEEESQKCGDEYFEITKVYK
jgi:hypothetical protein